MPSLIFCPEAPVVEPTAEVPTEQAQAPKGEAYQEQAVYPIKISDLIPHQQVVRGKDL